MTGRKRKKALLALLCALLLCVTGCMESMPMENRQNVIPGSLPEARSGPEATTGDRQTSREAPAVLYVPDAEGVRLNAVVETIVIDSTQTKQEAYVNKLLELIADSDFNAGGQTIRLSPVSNAVETTRDLVTVNLHQSARALALQSPELMFALRMAITNTLTELPNTNYVNILVNGRTYGLDVNERVPTGVMVRYPGTDVETYWNQYRDQYISDVGELQKTVALYFVSDDGSALLGEVRKLTFSDRDPAVYAKLLIRELSKGATGIAAARTLVPSDDYFERDPIFTQSEEGDYIELHLRPETYDFLTRQDSTVAMMLSSICYTLTGFIPQLDGIMTYIDGALVTELELMNDEPPWSMQSGLMTRESIATLAADVCTVYYPLSTGLGLCAVVRPIAQRLRTQPRALMRELMKPPAHDQLSRALPEEITDADILGLQIQGDTALLNVTAAFAAACKGMTEIEERNMVYAIVNTLTEIEGVTRVRFFVEGTQSPLAGHLYMPGEFMRHEGLIYADFVQ